MTEWLRSHVRELPDYPEPGIVFKDITPLLADVDAFRFSVDRLADHFGGIGVDAVVGIEARGFIFAAPVAYRLGVSLVPVRKPGKLPCQTLSQAYELEYGSDSLEVHLDAVGEGDRVVIVDDVLATGGTAAACAELMTGLGAEVAGLGFLLELAFLGGRRKLEGYDVESLLIDSGSNDE